MLLETSSTLRIIFVILAIALVLAVAGLLIITLDVLLLVFAGVLFGIFLNGLSGWIADHTPASYRWSYVAVVFLLLVVITSGIYYLGSQFVEQTSSLWAEMQRAADRLTVQLQDYEWARDYLPTVDQFQDQWTSGGVMPHVMNGLRRLMWAATAVFFVLFVGLYVAFEPDLYRTGIVKLVRPPRRERASEILHKLHQALGRWIIGRLISMSIIGVCTVIGLWLMGVPMPFTLGCLAALLTFIPNIGPVLATLPQALLALQVGTNVVLYVILFNVALQSVESYLITPLVQRYEVTLPPALTIVVQLVMTALLGIVGVFMAAPLTAAVMLLVQSLYIRDTLGDPSPGQLANRTE
ncbi:MAG: AI-2E family transporter [Planctomycetales bacterium]|nr:AI-2E family transporter [Planctomycetales bacterium]